MDSAPFGNLNCNTVALERRDELPLLRVSNAHADALIALQGAQVLEYAARGAQPLLWLSERAAFKRGQPVRGGIPVCWPWFGDIARNPEAVQRMAPGANLPAHGLVRAQSWIVEAIDETAAATRIVLSHATVAAAQPEWPHNATVRLTIDVGKTLRLALSTRNDDNRPIALTQALHAYFPVSDIRSVAISGLERTRYIDTLDAWREHIQQGVVEFGGETDRIYLDISRPIELFDRGWQRRIVLRSRNSGSAVVWNPWIDKARRLSQFAADAWQRMLCIETANAASDSIALAPGAGHTLEVEIADGDPLGDC